MAFSNANNTGPTRKDCLVFVVIVVVMSSLILPAVLAAREAARDSVCISNIYQLKLAVELYREFNGSFPPAEKVSEDGKSRHSWRMLILPRFSDYFDDNYRLNENWDSTHNLALMGSGVAQIFQCPSGADIDKTEFTNYVFVRGSETIFPEGRSIKLDDISDGKENTIVMVEVHGLDIHWREPRDLEFKTMSFEINTHGVPCINSPHPTGPIVTFADSSYRRLSDSITGADVRALLTRAAGDSPKRAELDKKDGTFGR